MQNVEMNEWKKNQNRTYKNSKWTAPHFFAAFQSAAIASIPLNYEEEGGGEGGEKEERDARTTNRIVLHASWCWKKRENK